MPTIEDKASDSTPANNPSQDATPSREANNLGNDSAGTQKASSDMSEVQSLRGEIKVLKELIFDLNNKYNSNVTNEQKSSYEFPPKSFDEIDTKAQLIRKEWGLN